MGRRPKTVVAGPIRHLSAARGGCAGALFFTSLSSFPGEPGRRLGEQQRQRGLAGAATWEPYPSIPPQSTRPPLPSASRGLEEAAVETRPDAAGTQQRAGRPSGGGGGEQRKPQAGKQVSIRTLPSLIPWKCVFDPVQRKCEQKSDAFIY